MGGRPNKIRSAGLEGVVRKLAADGLGYREIAAELKKRGNDIAYTAVGRFLNEEAGERREVARNVAAEQAHDAVPLVTQSLKTWVLEIGGLVQRTLDSVNKEPDPEAKERKLNRAAGAVSTLVQAGTRAAKTLHDITAGDAPAGEGEAVLGEVLGILAARQKRDEAETDED
jgi:hypothetical protein